MVKIAKSEIYPDPSRDGYKSDIDDDDDEGNTIIKAEVALGKYVGQQIEVICITNVSLEANHVPLSPSFQAFPTQYVLLTTQSAAVDSFFIFVDFFLACYDGNEQWGLVDHFLEIISAI